MQRLAFFCFSLFLLVACSSQPSVTQFQPTNTSVAPSIPSRTPTPGVPPTLPPINTTTVTTQPTPTATRQPQTWAYIDSVDFSCALKYEPDIFWFHAEPIPEEESVLKIFRSGYQIGGFTSQVAVIGNLALVGEHNILRFYDIGEPLYPALLSSVELPSPIYQIAIQEETVYTLHEDPDGLAVVDISDPAFPKMVDCIAGEDFSYLPNQPTIRSSNDFLVDNVHFSADCCGFGTWQTQSDDVPDYVTFIPGKRFEVSWFYGGSFTVSNNYAYFVVTNQPLQLLDLMDPLASIIEVDEEIIPLHSPEDITSTPTHLFIADGRNLLIVNIETPQKPELVTIQSFDEFLYRLDSDGNYLYVLTETSLRILDIRSPLQISELGRHEGAFSYQEEIAVDNGIVFMNSKDLSKPSILILDVSDPKNPQPLSRNSDLQLSRGSVTAGYLLTHSASKLPELIDARDLKNLTLVASGVTLYWISDIASIDRTFFILQNHGGIAVIELDAFLEELQLAK
ncbi:MAG: hypothetical protein H6656_02935 [Ardenticatenaceae bacterium]|nr:hypothetical protein [Ardenticatenaceae bacterium]